MSNRWGVLMPQWSERWLVLLSVRVSSCWVHRESLSVSNVRLLCGLKRKTIRCVAERRLSTEPSADRCRMESDLLSKL